MQQMWLTCTAWICGGMFDRMWQAPHGQWCQGVVFMKMNGKMQYPWRAVAKDGVMPDSDVAKAVIDAVKGAAKNRSRFRAFNIRFLSVR